MAKGYGQLVNRNKRGILEHAMICDVTFVTSALNGWIY